MDQESTLLSTRLREPVDPSEVQDKKFKIDFQDVGRGGHLGFSDRNVCLFVLRFYGPVNPMGSCRAPSVYLTTHLLGRLSPLSG